MKMVHEDGEVDVEGMYFDVADEIGELLQPILENSFTECIKYQLSEHPISVHLYKRPDQPFRVVAQTEAFNNQFLTYATPLVELVKETIDYEDAVELQALRTELQTCMDNLDIRLKELK